jgi:hypothetical protein
LNTALTFFGYFFGSSSRFAQKKSRSEKITPVLMFEDTKIAI